MRSLAADAESVEDAVEPKDASERALSVDSEVESAEVLEKNPLVMVCSLSIGTFGCRGVRVCR